jgi:transposase InsO family protein
MSPKGNCWDNAVAESFFATLKLELTYQNHWRTRTQARSEVFEYIELFATLTASGTVAWSSCPTEVTKPLDRLLANNWQAVAASYDMLLAGQRPERGSDVDIGETADVQCG